MSHRELRKCKFHQILHTKCILSGALFSWVVRRGGVLPCLSPCWNTSTRQLYICCAHHTEAKVVKAATFLNGRKWLIIWCVGRSKAPTVPGNCWTYKNHKPKWHVQVNQQKTEQDKMGKKESQMRAEFKLCYKGFKSSGSLLRTHTCIQPQCVRIPLGTWLFHSTGQAWNVHRAQLLHCIIIASTTLFQDSL